MAATTHTKYLPAACLVSEKSYKIIPLLTLEYSFDHCALLLLLLLLFFFYYHCDRLISMFNLFGTIKHSSRRGAAHAITRTSVSTPGDVPLSLDTS